MASPSRLAKQHDFIKNALSRGATKAAVAYELRVPVSTLKSYISSTDLDTVVATPQAADFEVTLEDKLKIRLAELEARARKSKNLDVQHELVLDEIRGAINASDIRFEPPTLDTAKLLHPHVQVALLSDTHAGEVVDAAGVDGMNEYNWTIMEQRLINWREALLSYKEYRPFEISELQLWVLGDMCSGSNHPEIVETNEYSAAEQGVRMGFLLGQLVESLVEHYPKITVYAVVGNHPRVANKPASKQVFNNFDWVAYKIMEQHLANYTSVTCKVPMGGFVVAEVAGLNYLLFHGDGIRSTMPGVPWGGVMRRVNELSKLYAQRDIKLHGFAVGHFHQSANVQNILMNGSIKGIDEYSKKNFGSGEVPTQLIAWFDEAKHRLTDVSRINP